MSTGLKAFLEAADYKIADTDSYHWHCYGDHAKVIDCEFGHASAYVVFNGKTQTVFEIAVVTDDDGPHSAYRWIAEGFRERYSKEAEVRNFDPNIYFDGRRWADTESFEDILEKVAAIRKGEEFDTRVVMSFDVDNETLELIEHAATIKGVTLEDFIVQAIQEVVDKETPIE